ncbi:MAG: hypothetical protein [Caudoviricetes sp.]|nr:MAG: hypothetical protein [Caudoviricetes sp.]
MMKTPISAFLDDGTHRIDIAVAGSDLYTPYHFGERQMKGFYSTPAIKTSLTEAQTRNGAHALSHGVLFAARVVTIPFIITASNRMELDDLKTTLQLFVGKSDVVYQVNDGSDSTFVSGMLSIEYSVDIDECNTRGEMTLTCEDAERLSASEYSTNIGFGLATTGGGMSFGKDRQGLVFPMNFGKSQPTGTRNYTVAQNQGSYTADVRIMLHGDMPGALFEWQDSEGQHGLLEYDGYISRYQTVLLDSKSESATISGSDFSGNLAYRNFPRIPAGGSVRIIMLSTAENNEYGGFATVSFRDTWM